MPLTSLTLQQITSWSLSATNADGYQSTVYGPDSIIPQLGTIDLDDWPQLYLDYLELAGSASTTITLSDLLNYVNEEFTPTAILAIILLPAANVWSIGPGAADGLEIWGGSGVVLPVQPVSGLMYLWDPAGDGVAVTGTTNQLKFTNTGGTGDTANLAIICAH